MDVEYYLGNCNGTQIKDMFCNFFPCAKKNEINKMMHICDRNSNQKIKEDPISPAEFHRYLFRFSKSPSDALNNVNLLRDYLEFVADNSPASRDSGCSDNE